jgi:hypothetical protein
VDHTGVKKPGVGDTGFEYPLGREAGSRHRAYSIHKMYKTGKSFTVFGNFFLASYI